MASSEVEANILNAWWGVVWDKLREDPVEFRRRLRRRQGAQFRRPLRAWCLSLRANDRRITDTHALIVPRHALTLHGEGHEGRYGEHEVILTDDLVKRVCDPYHIGPPGEPADCVATKLGCGAHDLMYMRRSGRLETTLKPGLRGRRGKPVPLLYAREYLDPSAREKRAPDAAFGHIWMYMGAMMTKGFRQTVARVPRYRMVGGGERFQAWEWVCPCCRKQVWNLYYPLPCPDLAIWQRIVRPAWPWGQMQTPVFACYECHNIISFSRGQLRAAWNQLVLHYSGGLMYGQEVEKPAWLVAERPREQTARAESGKRELVRRLLVTTELTQEEIGGRAKMSRASVGMMATAIYRREGVKGRKALREKLGGGYPVETVGRRMVG